MEQQSQRLEKIYNEDEEQPEDVLMIVELFKKLTIQYVFEQHGKKSALMFVIRMLLKVHYNTFCRSLDRCQPRSFNPR